MNYLHQYASQSKLSLVDRQIIELLTNYLAKSSLIPYQSTYLEIEKMVNLSKEIYDLMMEYEKEKRKPYFWES